MNGVQPFVYISTCGCVFSQAALKTVVSASSTSSPKEKEDSSIPGEELELELCPQCATKFSRKDNVLMLNPPPEEEEHMRENMYLQRSKEPTKKSKKRKNASSDDSEVPKKKAAPSTNPSIAAASRAVASSLATEEAKRKANMTDAVKSLYGDGKSAKNETFMTRGTFTRASA